MKVLKNREKIKINMKEKFELLDIRFYKYINEQ